MSSEHALFLRQNMCAVTKGGTFLKDIPQHCNAHPYFKEYHAQLACNINEMVAFSKQLTCSLWDTNHCFFFSTVRSPSLFSGARDQICCGQFRRLGKTRVEEWNELQKFRGGVQEKRFSIGHCRNVRGLGKSMVVFHLFEKLRYADERSTKFVSLYHE